MITFVHYHQIPPELFKRHLEYYLDHYTVTPLRSLAYREKIPQDPLFITFDDGWISDYALYPMFRQISQRVTIFLTVRFINSNINPRTDTLGDRNYTLTAEQIKEMVGDVNFQSHGLTHRDITQLSETEIRHELSESKKAIERLTGSPVYAYAYPYNKVDEKTTRILQECGYKLARMGERMLNKHDADRYTLKSIGIPQDSTVNDLRYRLLKARVKTFLRGYHVC